ncbi:DUF4395 domain-containing protein [Pullulanibacillus sp. KACC 23026]|uniref:DUF4395 domain-containing protein n=1 Tax=Pullulanibacillus sp. KACC 23026 TaxID=3028315 RepID=UPI0023B10AE3|nr:DUF4395 domain-containing protein [Pullulanibacillus sp. KACC 23026]WEG12006.1 DUF4395 domain-containing protein [Pullulanibacillus sp. KACC 23026]
MGIPRPLVRTNQWFIVITALAGVFITPFILILPFVIGVLTLIFKKNPIILLSKKFLKKPLASYIMEDKDQQLFNQWIATICLGLSLAFYALNIPVVGIIFSIMVILAAGIAIMGYCIGCTIRFRYKMWRYHRQEARAK